MRDYRHILLFSLIFFAVFCLQACEAEDYETGDGDLSYMRADFADIHTSEAKKVDYVCTDNGDSLLVRPFCDCEWATTPDSIYRALFYYNVKTKGDGKVEAISVKQVLALRMLKTSKMKEVYTDPLNFESAWVSPNRKYLNLGLYVKSGKIEGDDRQTLGMLCDTIYTRDNGSRLFSLRLFHHQNNIPEYYSARVYASMPLDSINPGDSILLNVNTYEDEIVRAFGF